MHNYNLNQTVNKLALPKRNLCARGDYSIFCNVRIYFDFNILPANESYLLFFLLFIILYLKGTCNHILLWASLLIQSMKPLTHFGFFSPPFHVPGLLARPHRSRSWSSCVAWVQRSYWARLRHMSSDSVQWTGLSRLAAPEHEHHPHVLRNKKRYWLNNLIWPKNQWYFCHLPNLTQSSNL